MPEFDSSLSSRELLEELLPKLKATEQFLNDTLAAKLESELDPRETQRLQDLKAEFELEITMIQLNLRRLLQRHADQLVDTMDDPEGKGDALLTLDEHEAVAIESIRKLYARSHELQTDTA
ncbi:hypothetical protein OCT51_12790 [Halomonas sp. LR3S48]|uniref:hypothetical protein n=1 Tax=Halomonas sp. LR3S48 TaxID=2982694 RepID=UPI0021E4AB19|nr:hypothetical protein [Halomonas sp. LR3S48]UYG02078.1 hypothetical protein OCT51_12790 [Halomonas sp. LR3S48]